MYVIQHHAYCGMTSVPERFDQHDDAMKEIARRLERYRRTYQVVTLVEGEEWEILEPEDCALVPDDCGTLTLRHKKFECRECGCAHETQEAARQCCMDAAAKE